MDGARGLGGYLLAYVALKAEQLFFSDHEHLATCITLPESVTKWLLVELEDRNIYYQKIEMFADHYFKMGAKYMQNFRIKDQ